MPLIYIDIPVITPIGIFYIEFFLNATLLVNVSLGITEYRNVKLSGNMEAAVVVYAAFSWGLRHIITIGVFMSGTVMRSYIRLDVTF